ncbi:MAG: hypothetical protein OHK0044_15920 [Burkholderiaceae bacterium]
MKALPIVVCLGLTAAVGVAAKDDAQRKAAPRDNFKIEIEGAAKKKKDSTQPNAAVPAQSEGATSRGNKIEALTTKQRSPHAKQSQGATFGERKSAPEQPDLVIKTKSSPP